MTPEKTIQKEEACALIGKSFLIKDMPHEHVCDAFRECLCHGMSGMWVTRSDPLAVCENLPSGVEVVWLSTSKFSMFKKAENLETLEALLHSAIKNNRSAILLERFDYLVNKHGSDKVLEMLYGLNDSIMLSKSTLLLRVSSSALPAAFISHLEQEFPHLPKRGNTFDLEKRHDLKETLMYIMSNPHCESKKVNTAFDITRTTARNRIYSLQSLGLVQVSKNGRKNALCLTELGKEHIKCMKSE